MDYDLRPAVVIFLAGRDFQSIAKMARRLSVTAKGIFQGIKLIGAIIVGILMISLLIGQSPAILISGLGAMAAVLMLVFKDPILARLPVSSFPPTICSNWATGWKCRNMAQMARSLILA